MLPKYLKRTMAPAPHTGESECLFSGATVMESVPRMLCVQICTGYTEAFQSNRLVI